MKAKNRNRLVSSLAVLLPFLIVLTLYLRLIMIMMGFLPFTPHTMTSDTYICIKTTEMSKLEL